MYVYVHIHVTTINEIRDYEFERDQGEVDRKKKKEGRNDRIILISKVKENKHAQL